MTPDMPHIWTLPLAPYRWALLQTPSRNLSVDEWGQMMRVLEAIKPALICVEELGDFDVAEAMPK